MTNFTKTLDGQDIQDYFVCDHWRSINPAWRQVLCELQPHELALLLNLNTFKTICVLPLSLLAYRRAVHAFSLDRELRENQLLCKKNDTRLLVDNNEDHQSKKERKIVNKDQYLALENCFRRHVKPKKQHEIIQLSQAINQLCEDCLCKHIIDIGAGQGHLSRLLAFKYGLKATTIEAIGFHNPKSEKFDQQVKFSIQKGCIPLSQTDAEEYVYRNQVTEEQNSPTHVTATIEPEMLVADFLNQVVNSFDKVDKGCECESITDETLTKSEIKQKCDCGNVKPGKKCNTDGVTKLAFNQKVGEECNEINTEAKTSAKSDVFADVGVKKTELEVNGEMQFVMTGLHACGNLTSTMLRLFVKSSQFRALASVGCCYMKLTTESSLKEIGYPMSSFVRGLPDHQLSYEALELACHFTDAYHEKLLDNSPSLHNHIYRAALQEIIAEKDPTFQHGNVKATIKHTETLTFQEYAEKALRKLGLNTSITVKQLERAQERLKKWKEVVAFYTLRLSIAPLIETIILLDRVIYLQEQGVSCQLEPIFDPLISPRNIVLLARK